MAECSKENCSEKARYGKVNEETGMFEKKHCKPHKQPYEKGKGPQWKNRYPDFIKICKSRNVKCLDTEDEFKRKTIDKGCDAMIKLQCLECEEIVETTTIDSFTNGNLGCKCNKNEHWYNRFPEFKDICKPRNVKCLDTEEEFKRKTKEKGAFAMIKLQCLECEVIVETTTINDFTQGSLGCKCNKKELWYKRFPEFKDICKPRNVKCLDTEEEFKRKTKEKRAFAMIKLQCLECEEIVETTTIDSFINQGNLGCKCNNYKSERLMAEYVNKHFTDNTFIKKRPDWLKNTSGRNLELDYYCEELKLALEYNGLQHYEYNTYFHKGNIENFHKQQERDEFKKKRCEEEGVYLIIIPYNYDCYNEEKLYEYIDEKISEWKITTNQEF